MPLREYIETYSEEEKFFVKEDIDKRTVCFYRDDNRKTRMIVGNNGNSDEDWESLIRDFEHK